MRKRYLELKDTNEHLLKQLERGQQELDRLNMKKAELEEELSASPVKQEAGEPGFMACITFNMFNNVNEKWLNVILHHSLNVSQWIAKFQGTPHAEHMRGDLKFCKQFTNVCDPYLPFELLHPTRQLLRIMTCDVLIEPVQAEWANIRYQLSFVLYVCCSTSVWAASWVGGETRPVDCWDAGQRDAAGGTWPAAEAGQRGQPGDCLHGQTVSGENWP